VLQKGKHFLFRMRARHDVPYDVSMVYHENGEIVLLSIVNNKFMQELHLGSIIIYHAKIMFQDKSSNNSHLS